MSSNINLSNIYFIVPIIILIIVLFFYINEHFGCNKCGEILKHQWVKNDGDCSVLCSGNGCTKGTWDGENCICE
jgi:hypothetical protein